MVDYPLSVTREALIDPARWCDILILHPNIKYCRASTNHPSRLLDVRIGRKNYQTLELAYWVEFDFSVATMTSEYFDLQLKAKAGPFGARDYLIRLEAVSIQGNKTFLHLTYSYTYNLAGRLAMQGYLETIGSETVGFAREGDTSDNNSVYIGEVRGLVERNTMRYYLAIDAYLGELATAPEEQLEKCLQRWVTSTELYPQQLREIDRAEYLGMKRREFLRQQKLD